MQELFTCSICGREHSREDDVLFDNQHICHSCYEHETVVCRCCGTRIWAEDAHDGNICESCYDEYYTTCEDCGRVIYRDDAFFYDNDRDCEYPYCSSCFHQNDDRVIEDYYYKPEPVFHGDGKRFYGIELEVDEGGERDSCAEEIMDIGNRNGNHIYCKHDGSLNDGFEIVSHPATLEYHTKTLPWRDIMAQAKQLGYRSHMARTCGLHVHISRAGLGDTYDEQEATIAKILYFYEKFWNEILKFSRRTETQVNRWAMRYGGGLINPQETLKHAKSAGMGRYVAVNLENAYTVEMRIFRGTLKYETFIATLQLVDEICNVAVSLSDERIQSLTWLEFVQRIPKSKLELINYLKARQLYVNEPVIAGEEV